MLFQRYLFLCILMANIVIQPAYANEAMVYIYNAPESTLDRRYDYQWEILATALERTKDVYGDFILKPALPMSELRQTVELMKASGSITVMYLGVSEELEANLIPVRIPVDKNLSGYMVYLINKKDQMKFSAVNTLDDLRQFQIGQGVGWLDVDILSAGGFKVITSSSYDSLFYMLLAGRFDAFQRSVTEVIEEFDQRKDSMPDLAIEQSILFYYPLPMYFWFSKTPEGQRLAERAREGMMLMIDDGTYDEIFYKYKKASIDRLHLKDRKLFKIENPLLDESKLPVDERFWFKPFND